MFHCTTQLCADKTQTYISVHMLSKCLIKESVLVSSKKLFHNKSYPNKNMNANVSYLRRTVKLRAVQIDFDWYMKLVYSTSPIVQLCCNY